VGFKTGETYPFLQLWLLKNMLLYETGKEKKPLKIILAALTLTVRQQIILMEKPG